MNLTRGIFLCVFLFILCCSALFLLILTLIGLGIGIFNLFLGEPEINGIFLKKPLEQLVIEAIICGTWILGFGISFVANILLINRTLNHIKKGF